MSDMLATLDHSRFFFKGTCRHGTVPITDTRGFRGYGRIVNMINAEVDCKFSYLGKAVIR